MVVAELSGQIAKELLRHPRCQRALQLEGRRIGFADGDIQTTLCGDTFSP